MFSKTALIISPAPRPPQVKKISRNYTGTIPGAPQCTLLHPTALAAPRPGQWDEV